MQQILEKIRKYLKTLSKRDQIAMVVIVFVGIIFIWDTLLRAPLSANRMVVEHDVKQVEAEIVVVQTKMQALQKNVTADPDSDTKAKLARYIDENKRLDISLKKTSVQVINPQEMTSMLEQILASQTGLKFVSLKNLPATPEFIESPTDVTANDEAAINAEVAESINTIYRHSVVMQLEGSYHSVLAYLQKLEQFPWRFFWQGIEIETETGKYPNALITLEVYTLGFREGIIGV